MKSQGREDVEVCVCAVCAGKKCINVEVKI